MTVSAQPVARGSALGESVAFRKALEIVAQEFDVSVAALLSRRRPEHLALARHALLWAVQQVLEYTYTRLAHCMGQDDRTHTREHSSIGYGIRNCLNRQSIDPEYRRLCATVVDRLRAEVALIPDSARQDAMLLALVKAEAVSRKLVDETGRRLQQIIGAPCVAFEAKCPACRAWTGLRMLETALMEDPARIQALRSEKLPNVEELIR